MPYSHVSTLTLCFALSVAAPGAIAQDGNYDTTWHGAGRTLVPVGSRDDGLTTMAIQPDGKIVLVGNCSVPTPAGTVFDCIARLLPTGVIDLSFGPNETGAFVFNEFANFTPNDYPGRHGLLIQPDGRIVVAGRGSRNYGALGVHQQATVLRLSPNGTLELGPSGERLRYFYFSHHATAPENEIEAAALLANGKIIVVGSSNRVGSSPPNRDFGVARLNTDLTLDTSFSVGAPTAGVKLAAFDQGGDNEDRAYAVAVQPDGKIVVVGSTSTDTEGKEVAILRLNADGTPDAGFGNNGRVWFDSGFEGQADDVGYAVKLDRQGRIVIAGSSQFEGADHDFFAARRLPADGGPDLSFNGVGFKATSFDRGDPYTDEAYDLVIQSDGKIVLAGFASVSASTYTVAVTRMLDDGTDDAQFGNIANGRFVGTFAPATGTTDFGTAIALAPGNRLMIAGSGASGAGANMLDFGLMRLTVDLIFADGFQ